MVKASCCVVQTKSKLVEAYDELGGCDIVDRERAPELFAVLDLCHLILSSNKCAKVAFSLGHPIERVYEGCKKPHWDTLLW